VTGHITRINKLKSGLLAYITGSLQSSYRGGGQMEQVFQGLIDRTRSRLNVKRLKTLFGMKTRPYRDRTGKAPRCEVVVETPSYDLTIFKLH